MDRDAASSRSFSIRSADRFRLKANKLNLWNHDSSNLTCPHSSCSDVEHTNVKHVFWDCPVAATAWADIRARWQQLGENVIDDAPRVCFSLEMPETPERAWNAVRATLSDEEDEDPLRDELYPVVSLLWRHTAVATLHAIWCAQLRLRHEPTASATVMRAVINASIHGGLSSLGHLMRDFDSDAHRTPRGRVMAVLVATLQDLLSERDRDRTCPRPLASRSVFLLFFDGGSRGNPGPGGSGSVIVRLDIDTHATDICWASSMSYARVDTTNNTAEYWGLIHGLRRAAAARYSPLHVIGDSNMIIRQHQRHRVPKQPRLRQLYLKARRRADGLGIRSWTHHYREHNKMADRAANIAMDTALSQQTTAEDGRPIIMELAEHLNNDVRQWITTRQTALNEVTLVATPTRTTREHTLALRTLVDRMLSSDSTIDRDLPPVELHNI